MPLPSRVLAPICLLPLMLLAGCVNHGGADFAIRSVTNPKTSLRGDFSQGIYRFDDANTLTVLLLDGPIDDPTQAVTIRLMWRPHVGKTPSDKTATNATIHYIIFAGPGHREVGLYSGAGFVYPNSAPGADTLKAGMWEASLRLTDKTAGFDDLLGQAMGNGGLKARRDDAGVDEMIRRLNVLLRERLGYPRMVEGKIRNPKPEIRFNDPIPNDLMIEWHVGARITMGISPLGNWGIGI